MSAPTSIVFTLLVGVLAAASAAAQNTPERLLSGGLAARLDTASRSCDGDSMTIAIELANRGPVPIDLIFVEQVSAVDNAGTAYRIRDYAGTARCRHGYIDDCLGLSGRGARVPLEQFTRLDPGATSVVTFDFWHSTPRRGTLVSFSALYGYRVVDPGRESIATDAEKLRSVKTQTVGFGGYPLSVVGCR